MGIQLVRMWKLMSQLRKRHNNDISRMISHMCLLYLAPVNRTKDKCIAFIECKLVSIISVSTIFIKKKQNNKCSINANLVTTLLCAKMSSQRAHDIVLTSMRRNDVASTSKRYHFCTKCPLGSYFKRHKYKIIHNTKTVDTIWLLPS